MNGADFVAQVGDIDSRVIFFPGVARQHREDIQDALLFAQLRAGHLYDFQAQWNSWIHNYRQHLVATGFKLRGVVTDNSLVIGRAEDLDRASFKINNPQVRERLAEQVRNMFSKLEIKQVAGRFFQDEYLSGVRLGSFQVMPCVQTDSGELMTLLCSLRLNVDDYAASGKRLILHFKGGAYHFAAQAFAERREEVRRYLRGKSNAVITRLEL